MKRFNIPKAALVMSALVCGRAGWVNAAAAPTSQPAGDDLTNMSLEDLMNVEVTTVSRRPQRVGDAPAAVTVIGQEDIQRSGLDTIPDLLRLAPGMDVGRITSNTWAISARGFNDEFSNKLLVQMDGRTVYTPLFSGVFWNTLDYVLPDLDRIEVVRGPGATLWGANAVNGVVSIQSKSAADTQGWLIDGQLGTQQSNGAVRFGGRIDDETAFRVYTKYRYFGDQETPTGGTAYDRWQTLQSGFRVDRQAGPDDTLTVQGDIFGQQLHDAENLWAVTPPFNSLYHDRVNFDGGNLLGRWTHTFSDTSNMSLQAYFDQVDGYSALAKFRQYTGDMDFEHHFALAERQSVTWGLGYRFVADDVFGTEQLSFATPERNLQLISGFIQDDLALVPDRLHLFVGTKLEYNSYTNLEVEPGARLLWSPNEKNSVWGSVSRATRTPARYEEDERNALLQTFGLPNGFPAAATSTGNVRLDSEDLTAYELGYRFEPFNRLSVDVSAYYNNYDHLIGLEALTPFTTISPVPHEVVPFQFANNQHGQAYGGEIAATWKVSDSWKLIGSYSLMELHLQGTNPGTQLGQLQSLQNASPEHQVQLRSYYNVTRNLQFNALGFFVSGLTQGNIPAYFRADANIDWEPVDRLHLMVGVQNIFDNHHPEFPSDGFFAATEMPRTFFARLTYQF
jgi:iron complex outermembrane recepter protein